MANSTAQTVNLVEVYDYLLAVGDPSSSTSPGLSGKKVKATLSYDRPITQAPDSVVFLGNEPVYSTVTDSNGFWHLFVTPNNRISVANTYYVIKIEDGPTYRISVSDVAVPGVGWQSSAILLDSPAALAPVGQTVGPLQVNGTLGVTGNVTLSALTTGQVVFPGAAGLLSGDAGLFWDNTNKRLGVGTNAPATVLDVSGVTTLRGVLSMTANPAQINMTGTGVAQIVGGTVGFQINSNNNLNANLSLTDAGVATIRGGLIVSAGGLSATGGITIQTGNLTFSPAVAVVVGGATGLFFDNNANTATNLQITDVGDVSIRGSLDLTLAGQLNIAPTVTTLTTINRGPRKALIINNLLTTFGAGAQTLSSTALVGGEIEHTVTAAVADTLDTGANIDALFGSLAVGDTFDCLLTIIGAFTVTLTAAAGITIKGTTALVGTAAGKGVLLRFRRTGANAWTCYVILSS